jgi:ribonuclease VapC
MVIDTSAIVAIFFGEEDAAHFRERIAADPVRLLSAGTFLEAAMVIEARFGEAGAAEFDRWIELAQIDIVPVSAELAAEARSAWRRYGKGRHPAALNYGDCFSYALARVCEEPLLYKGNDFSRTDIGAEVPR